jgi:NOL1/NOP2/fmu family ribosome biogenesis protein
VERQRQILTTVWSALKQDGIIIYSTCTFNRQENEENVQWMINELGAELLPIKLDESWGITQTDGGYRFYPHKTIGEGFFLSVLRKTTNDQSRIRIKNEKNKNTKILPDILSLKNKLLQPDNWKIVVSENNIKALPVEKADEIEFLEKKLKFMSAGVLLAAQKGKDLIPETGLALSKNLDVSQCHCVEVDFKTAILFLQKEAVELPQADKGYVLLTYKKVPLGWVKNLGNRTNNLYPQEWRIRMKIAF